MFAWLKPFLSDLPEEWHLVALSNIEVEIEQQDLNIVHGLTINTLEIVVGIFYCLQSICYGNNFTHTVTVHINVISISL